MIFERTVFLNVDISYIDKFRSLSPTKEAKSSPKKKNEIEKKAKGAKGRPIGWRKEDKGKGYLHFVGLKK